MTAVLPAEATPGRRTYLCAFESPDGARSWLVLDDAGEEVVDRRDVKDTVSIAALCEIAEESAVGGDLDELLSQLVALRLTESPDGIDEAEDGRPRTPADDRRAATARLTGPPGRDRRGHAATRARARPGRSLAVHRRPEGSAGDAGRAPPGGRRRLPRPALLCDTLSQGRGA